MNLVEAYYDKCQFYYTWLWSGKSLGLHYGFWDKDTKSLQEALINQYRLARELLQPQPGELILDAGCGVGGASIWLAQKTAANFVGITLSSKQLALAIKNARKYKVLDQIEFRKMDFFATAFADDFFDSIFFIESFCYSYPHPEILLKEMRRILKPGGKIVISDGIFPRQPKSPDEQRLFRKFFSGWKLSGGNTAREIIESLRRGGFKNIRFIDKTAAVKKTGDFIYRRGLISYPLLKILRFFRLISQIAEDSAVSTIIQKELINQGLLGYGVFSAER